MGNFKYTIIVRCFLDIVVVHRIIFIWILEQIFGIYRQVLGARWRITTPLVGSRGTRAEIMFLDKAVNLCALGDEHLVAWALVTKVPITIFIRVCCR